ncbi:MAG: hypothetical protein V3V14_12265 [Saprospiraceae bacterium]
MNQAFIDYTNIIDIPIPDKKYKIYVNEDRNWWTENNDSLYYASEWIAVVPSDNPYVDVLDNNVKFRFIIEIIINGHSLIEIKNFINYYEHHRKYIK